MTPDDPKPQISLEEMRARMESRRQAAEAQAAPEAQPIDSEFLWRCCNDQEEGDGHLFSRMHEGRFMYNASSGEWMRWSGHHWELDVMQESTSAVRDVADAYAKETVAIQAQIVATDNEKDRDTLEFRRKAMSTRVQRLKTSRGRRACLEFAATSRHSTLAVRGDDFDSDPWLLGCANCVIDLRTGETRPGSRDDLITKASPVEWRGLDEPAPLWEKAVLEILNNRQDGVDYLQKLFGYAVTGLTTEPALPILWGKGRNGKTVIVEMISQAIGPLAGPINSAMLLDTGPRSAAGPSPDVMGLRGMRMVFASETDQGQKISPSRVKWFTGSDSLVGRNPHDRHETRFRPSHTLFLLTNHEPRTPPGGDYALWERMHMVPFELSFVDREPRDDSERRSDKELLPKLREELPGILAWLVRGCLLWQRDGLQKPQFILDATEAYRRSEDMIEDFIEDVCIIDPAAETSSADLYERFSEWWESNVSKRVPTQNSFGRMMKGKYKKEKRGIYRYLGIRLK